MSSAAQRAHAARRALQHELLLEHHRLSLEAAYVEYDDPVASAVLRRRAWVWRTTALRIPDVPTSRYPRWLLDHLAGYCGAPVVGGEYVRVRDLIEERSRSPEM